MPAPYLVRLYRDLGIRDLVRLPNEEGVYPLELDSDKAIKVMGAHANKYTPEGMRKFYETLLKKRLEKLQARRGRDGTAHQKPNSQ